MGWVNIGVGGSDRSSRHLSWWTCSMLKLRFIHIYFFNFYCFMHWEKYYQTTLSQVNIYLSQVNCVILSQDENLFESNKNLFGSSIFVFLSQRKNMLGSSIFFFELKRLFFDSKRNMLEPSIFLFRSKGKSICIKKTNYTWHN